MNILNLLNGNAIGNAFKNLWQSTGLYAGTNWQNYVMILISFVLVYLAIVKKFEPLLLLPIAFGMFIVNVPGAYKVLFGTKGYVLSNTLGESITLQESNVGDFISWLQARLSGIDPNLLVNEKLNGLRDAIIAIKDMDPNTCKYSEVVEQTQKLFSNIAEANKAAKDGDGIFINALNILYPLNAYSLSSETVVANQGLFYYLYKGVDWVIYPPIIFLGIGAMTDFGPLIARPKSMLIGAAAQVGIFITFVGAYFLFKPEAGKYTVEQIAAAISIIGGADGPTAIYVTKKLAEDFLPMIAIAAYSYMALIPVIQKPLMKLFTTESERKIKMKQARKVSKTEKVVFPLIVCLIVGLLLPDAMPLLGMLMLGNLFKESGVVGRLVDTATNSLMNIVVIFLGVMVGSKAVGSLFLSWATIKIILLGLAAFCLGTITGILSVKLLNLFSKEKMNPLIGSAGVSAVPMAARISEEMGTKYDPTNHLLMHAMGPNVAGVIGSAIAAGVLLALFGA